MLEHLIAYLHSALPDMRSQDSTLGTRVRPRRALPGADGDPLRRAPALPPGLPGDLAGMPVPPLLLMTLVENAVKHGVERKPGPVSVSLDAQRAGAGGDDHGRRRWRRDRRHGAGQRRRPAQPAPAARGAVRRAAAFDLRRTPDGVTEAVLTLPLMEQKLVMEMAA
jgi:hypothetical protein